MDDDQGFLDAIAENPKDDTNRLVYADWLEERGDIRAEFLRLECSLPKLIRRYRELEQQIDPRWRGAVSNLRSVVLLGYELRNKLRVIKLVREITSLGLKEAKDLVESDRPIIRSGLQLDQAEELARRFSKFATVIIEPCPSYVSSAGLESVLGDSFGATRDSAQG